MLLTVIIAIILVSYIVYFIHYDKTTRDITDPVLRKYFSLNDNDRNMAWMMIVALFIIMILTIFI